MAAPGLGNYLFIDGNYLRRAYEDTMRQIFPANAVSQRTLNFPTIKKAAQASKVFYYDTVDGDKADADDRRQFIEFLNGLDGFHIREGTVSTREKKQKQVDVALAVECLTHAFHKNVWHVSLLAGDLDFKPLVDALVNLGIHVHVFYERKSGNRKLYRAADVGVPITLRTFWEWSTADFRAANPCPVVTINTELSSAQQQKKGEGTWKGRTIGLYEHAITNAWVIYCPARPRDDSLHVTFSNKETLLKYFDIDFGDVTWLEK